MQLIESKRWHLKPFRNQSYKTPKSNKTYLGNEYIKFTHTNLGFDQGKGNFEGKPILTLY